MPRSDMIASRLPHFYKYWDRGSSVHALVDGVGKQMDESEKELAAIMRSHWVDTANGRDLDRLGSLFSVRRKEGETDRELRGRIKTSVISFKGGGTQGSVRMLVRITLGLPPDAPVDILENPAARFQKTWTVGAGAEWTVNPRSIADTVPAITIAVDTPGARITDPTITNLTTGEPITFKGDMAHGDTLRIEDGQAILNGRDATSRLSTATMPSMPRRKTKWKYTEAVGANVGVFDTARFDQSVFTVDIASQVTLEWPALLPATFVVNVPKAQLDRAGVSANYLQDLIDGVKACGVKVEVKVV